MPVLTPARPTVAGDVAPLLPVVGADVRVPLVTGGTARYANLDNAASTPALTAVAECVAAVLPTYASVHRGAGWLSQLTTSLHERSRRTVARFCGARAEDLVVFTRSTTDAVDLLSRCVPQDAAVLVCDLEHHANLLPWRRRGATVLPCAQTLDATVEALLAELARRPYALLAVTGASNVTGQVLPLERIVPAAHAAGTRVLVDGAQLVPHRGLDLAASGVDWVVFSGHKLYAPFGAGALVGRRDWLDAAEPYLAGGGATLEVGPEAEEVRWATGAQRHEAGSPNVLGAAALARACEVLAALPAGALRAHEDALRGRLVRGLVAVPGVRIAELPAAAADAVGVVTFTVRGFPAGLVAAYLSAEHGIGVRDGRFCAHPLAARLGLVDGGVRVSTGAGSSSRDVDRLLGALRRLVAQGPSWRYAPVAGRWAPVGDPRPAPGGSAGGCGADPPS
ncbi:aminotransferase class V-fold PLP-dependent enzyme [Kineococcus sp. NUM-3379]